MPGYGASDVVYVAGNRVSSKGSQHGQTHLFILCRRTNVNVTASTPTKKRTTAHVFYQRRSDVPEDETVHKLARNHRKYRKNSFAQCLRMKIPITRRRHCRHCPVQRVAVVA